KKKKKSWAQMLVMVIIAIIVVVIAIYTGYVATELFGWAAGVSAAAGGVVTTAAAFTAAAVAAAAVGYAAGYATSAITQGLAIAVDLQEDFDWGAARDMGKSFAISSVAAGITSVAGAGNATGQVLTRGAVQMGRQYLENDGKITNWAGVALAMVGTKGVSETSHWSETVSFVNKNRNLVGAGLSVVEKFARGREVNTLDWTNVAATAVAGESGIGHYVNDEGIQWGTVAREALFAGGLSLVVGSKYGQDAGLNYFGSQLGTLATGVMSEQSALENLRSNPHLSASEIAAAFNDTSLSAYQRQQQLNARADKNRTAIQAGTQQVADTQQADESWGMGRPGEQGGARTFAATPPANDERTLLPPWADGNLPYSEGENLSTHLQTANAYSQNAEQAYLLAANADRDESIALALYEAAMSPDGDKFNDPILQASGLFDDDVAGLTPRDLQRRVVDRLYGTASDYYLAAEAAVELERSVLGLVQSGSEFVSGRYEEKSTPDDIYKQSSPLEQVGINIAIAGRNVKDAVVGVGELGMAILNDQRGPNNLTNRGIRQWNAALDAYEVLRDDPRAWSAAKSVVTEYIPSMPMAEQGGAITELVGTLGLGATTRVGTAAKGASLLEGFAAKAKEVVDLTRKLNEIKLQSPVVLELSASKLYSGLPLDGVRVKSLVVDPSSINPPNRIYSARELVRRADEPGPFHNFPESFNDEVFAETRTVVSPNYVQYTKPGTITLPGKPIYGNSSTMIGEKSAQEIIGYTPSRTVEGVFEIGVRPSASSRTEVITHRFFRPNE
ncbi:MAG: hypothetical protein KZQ99_23030, partial [Candidatus Thiodiazotropha sp. (ex Dulcina madagascariensis)]|nr:hypothetical protein [Candidatus Thiodiazotropha sp. (ex Dulcina madagascariensis)]